MGSRTPSSRRSTLRHGLDIRRPTIHVQGLDFIAGHGEEFEKALTATGFGKFHFLLLTVCGCIYLNTAMGITILSFVLPSATCDFRMTSRDKGWLTAAPMLGMLMGSYFWGCLADTKGRRVVLIGALILDGVCGLASSITPYFSIFMLFRYFNGFGVAGAMGICFPYLGEFQPSRYRETILCWMELFWVVGIIALPGVAWIIIPMDFQIVYGDFKFGSWNLFVAICSVPCLMLAGWLLTFPESPKFLLECGEADAALDVLREMYTKNTGRNSLSFPILSLREKVRTMSVISQQSQKSVRSLSLHKPKELKILMTEIWEQTKALVKPPHVKYTVITCLIQFGLTTSYYTLMVWFPELFYRFEEYENMYPGKSASICEVSSVVVTTHSLNETILEKDIYCGEPLEDSVFLHTLIIGVACIPTSFWLPLCVHKLGAKFFLISSLVLAGGVTIGLYFVQSSTMNLVLSCIFEALTSLAISVVYCVMVDLFPTNLRVMAAALALTFGRGGALFGNLIFGFLIDLHCLIPIALFSAMLFASGALCILLPQTGSKDLD